MSQGSPESVAAVAEMSARDLKKFMACALAIAISEALQRLSTYVCR